MEPERGFLSFPLEGKAARRYAATDEVLLDLEALPAALEAVVTFPPHPPRCAQHLLLEEKAAHGPPFPPGEGIKNTDRPKGQSVFLVGEDGFPLTGINFDSIFRAKKNTNHPKG